MRTEERSKYAEKWHIYGSPDGKVLGSDTGRKITNISYAINDADANLIAASPDMLLALKYIAKVTNSKLVKEAIAKAEGK